MYISVHQQTPLMVIHQQKTNSFIVNYYTAVICFIIWIMKRHPISNLKTKFIKLKADLNYNIVKFSRGKVKTEI